MTELNGIDQITLRYAIKCGWFRSESLECVLPSGRKFRYKMRDYPFPVFALSNEIDAVCCKIIMDKYRYCTWDRDHPKTHAEVEIFDTIKAWMLRQVAGARALDSVWDATAQAEEDALLAEAEEMLEHARKDRTA